MSGKGVLGIIGCYGISDQIIRLFENDRDIENVFVIDNEEGLRFAQKVRERNIDLSLVLVRENEPVWPANWGLSILLWLNPMGLHDVLSEMCRSQEEALSALSDHADSVLFCYGQCRIPELRLGQMIAESPVPVTFLTDRDGEIVDDCFAAVIGGKRDYLECITGEKGALLVTTGYAEGWKRRREKNDLRTLLDEVEGMRLMFEEYGYRRILMLADGCGDVDRFDEDVRAFSKVFGLEVGQRECSLAVFEQSYGLAKERMGTSSGDVRSSEMPVARSSL